MYRPGKWGAIKIHLSNPGDEAIELLAATYFKDQPTLQFGRRAWAPPHSRIETWHPVRLPNELPDEGRRAQYQTLVMRPSSNREVLIRDDSGRLEIDGALQSTGRAPVTGILDSLDEEPRPEGEAAINLLIVCQEEELGFRQNTFLSERIFVPAEESLEPLDQLVLLDDRLADDEGGLAAVRRWLFAGGRLWVLLDHADPRVLERLVGDLFTCEVVDRVGLTTVELESAGGPGGGSRSTAQYDRPVELVRTLVSDVDVAYTVGGWPAAFWKSCGAGRLLVTTLGPRGWMRNLTAADRQRLPVASGLPPAGAGPPQAPDGPPQVAPPPAAVPADEEEPADPTNGSIPDPQKFFGPLDPMKGLAAVFFSPRPDPLLPPESLQSAAREYVGYSLPPRWQIMGLLVGFLAIVLGIGAALVRFGRLEILGAVGPLLAIAASAGLVALGRSQRESIPPTVATVQFVQPLAGTDDVRVEGLAGLYSPDGGDTLAAGQREGWVLPEMTGVEGTTRRMTWTDLGAWSWEHLTATAGLRTAEFRQSATLKERVEAVATFGPQGVVGRWAAGGRGAGSDALLAARDGRIGATLADDGTFTAPAARTLTPEQFLEADLLTDEQARRRETYRQLLTDPERRDFPESPLLLFWTNPWDCGFSFGEDRRRLGSALVSVPIRWERPPAGTHVAIPAPLLPYRAATGPDGAAPSGFWDYRQRRWERKSSPATTWLRFQAPRVLLPLDLEAGRVEVQVSGPVGRLEIAGYAPSGVVPLQTWIDPVGTLSFEITRSDVLHTDDSGGLLLRLSGGDPDRPHLTRSNSDDGKVSYWQIESLKLELFGKTTGIR